MTGHQRKLVVIHAMAFILLLATWLAGGAIESHTETPLVALYYVLHIFPGSLVFVLVLFYWLGKADEGEPLAVNVSLSGKVNRLMHHLYYSILLALPFTGVLIFFEPVKARPGNDASWWMQLFHERFIYHLHASLFDVLLVLVAINLLVMLLGRLLKQ